MPLTDNQLSNIFVQLHTDYKEILNYTTNKDDVAAGLDSLVSALFEKEKGLLKEYSQDVKEQARLYKAVDLLISLLPSEADKKDQNNRHLLQHNSSWRGQSVEVPRRNAPSIYQAPRRRNGRNFTSTDPLYNVYINQRVVNNYYQPASLDHDRLFWFWMGSNFNNRGSCLHSLYCCDIFSGNCCSGGHHVSHSSSNDNEGNGLVKLVVFIVLAAACGAAIYAGYYLLKQTAESISRILNNEGYMQGFFPLLAAVLGGVLGNLMATKLLSGTFTALALSAGWSPAIVIGVLAVSLTCIMATVFAVGTKSLVEKNLEDKNAIDPYDPCTYRLTDEDKAKGKDLDEDLRLFAIIALRREIGATNQSNAGRFFSPPPQLAMVRKVRNGECESIMLEGKVVDLRKKSAPEEPAWNIPNQDSEGLSQLRGHFQINNTAP